MSSLVADSSVPFCTQCCHRSPTLLCRVAVAVLFATGLSLPGVAAAQAEEEALSWNRSEWGSFSTAELAAFGFLVAGALASTEISNDENEAGWRGGILFDEPLRDALRLESAEARAIAGGVSDILLYSLVAWPVLDGGGALVFDRDQQLATQMTGISALSFAASFFTTGLIKRLARRERPYGRDCPADEESHGPPSEDCTSQNRYQSFHSGHAAMSFTGASLVCAHHGALPIYGGGIGDTLACASAMTFATATSLLRVLADRHYVSDVLVGAIVGVLAGFVLPSLTHYQRP